MRRCGKCGHVWEPDGTLVEAMLAPCPKCGEGPPAEVKAAWEKFDRDMKEKGYGWTPLLPVIRVPEIEVPEPNFRDLLHRYGPGKIRSDYYGVVTTADQDTSACQTCEVKEKADGTFITFEPEKKA